MVDIRVIIPAINEGDSIGKVVSELPKHVTEIIVADNGSQDDTAENARKAGATVVTETRKGYGYACLKGLEYISKQSKVPDIIVFIERDSSD